MTLIKFRSACLSAAVAGLSACGSSSDHADSSQQGTGATTAALYVGNGGGHSISIIDATSLQVVKTLRVDAEYRPHHISLSRDGKTVLVSAPMDDLSGGHSASSISDHMAHRTGAAMPMSGIYEIATDTQTMDLRREIEATVHNATFTSDGKQVLLSMMERGMMSAYDTTTFKEAWSIAVGEMPLEVSLTPDGKEALVALSGASALAIVDLANRSVRTVATGMTPVGAWLGRDAAYVTNEGDMTVTVLGLNDLAVRTTFDAGGMPGQAFPSPDGRELWIALEDESKIRIADPSTGETIAEIAAGVKPHGIAFEPSGERVFVTDETDGKVLVFDRVKRSLLSSIAVGAEPNGIIWVPAH